MGNLSAQAAYGAYWLWMESVIGEAWAQLDASGIPAILLKGPTIARWLYEDDVRYSTDVDLLVPPAQFHRAQVVLAELGYDIPLAEAASCEIGPNTTTLRNPNGARIDLHHRLIGTPADPPERCWEVLSGRTIIFTLVTGVEVVALDVPARAMHLALHAAQNGPLNAKPMADLHRGLAQVPFEDWQDAAALALSLGSVQAFAEGMRLCEEGAAMADDLGLARAPRDVELELRVSSAPFESFFFARLAETAGFSNKAGLVGRKLWPTPDFMRLHFPLAGRGRAGLLLAHFVRPLLLLPRSGPALAAWARARSRVSRGSARQ